ncbi:hypothetical protein GGR58DRAFT_501321 [Xylaria digitata]|nr:hypothetical protein GGR58DRAFT_501321 [Xylaria digitata]
MPNRFEDLVKAVADKSTQDKRAQPWKKTTDTSSSAPEVDSSDSKSESQGGFNASHKSSVDVRTNAF